MDMHTEVRHLWLWLMQGHRADEQGSRPMDAIVGILVGILIVIGPVHDIVMALAHLIIHLLG
ncbi:hypothetical protein KGQ72_00980 [Patescibacteria group bacterium]|nr:hypothetical protein [Patescibacteria group bacterium]